MKHASKCSPSASLMRLARSEALQKGAPEPCMRRAPGALSYAVEGGSPRAGADPDEAPDATPSSWGPTRRSSFFLGMVSGGPSLLLSGLSIAAAWKARSREHPASLSSHGTVMIPYFLAS